jgi:hypothetical protein
MDDLDVGEPPRPSSKLDDDTELLLLMRKGGTPCGRTALSPLRSETFRLTAVFEDLVAEVESFGDG